MDVLEVEILSSQCLFPERLKVTDKIMNQKCLTEKISLETIVSKLQYRGLRAFTLNI